MALGEYLQDLNEDLDISVAALDYMPLGNEATIRDELAERFGSVQLVRQRYELRPTLHAAHAVLWYGVTQAIPNALTALGPERPASIRVVHTDRYVDGPAFARRWQRVIDATVCVTPTISRRIPGAVFIPNPLPRRGLEGPAGSFFDGGPGSQRPTLGFLGRLIPLKNAEWLVQNVASIGCNLLLQALDTELQTTTDLERLAETLGVRDRIHFLPPGRDVGTLLRSIDALAVVSEREGFPRVVIEAGSLGVPVIATRVGALPETFANEILFIDSENGIPVAESLQDALTRLDANLGERLRQRVLELCDGPEVASRYAAVCRDAIVQAEETKDALSKE